MARQRRPGAGRPSAPTARAGRGRLSRGGGRRRSSAALAWRARRAPPGLRCRARREDGAQLRRGPAAAAPRAWAGQGRAPCEADPDASRCRRLGAVPGIGKSVASGPMARGPEVRPTAGPRQAGRADRGRPRPSGRSHDVFRRLGDLRSALPERLRDAVRGPSGPNFRAFPIASERLPNHVR